VPLPAEWAKLPDAVRVFLSAMIKATIGKKSRR
jgi:hypothetical protein